MSLPPDDDEPTIVPIRSPGGGRARPSTDVGGSGMLPLGSYLGDFEITGRIGEGGFGIVYLAYDHSLERQVAIKEYMPSALATRADGSTVVVRSARHEEPFQAGLRSFINEARLLARFDHPSLVKVYRFWTANGTAYMVMPFYEGITLKAALRRMETPPDEAWLKNLLRPLLDALELLHGDHVYHRDIAPDNILMLGGTQPLLLDFGAARRVIGDLTHDLTAILKPGYAPVEQYADVSSMKQGPWTDVYALAAVIYFAITGKTPDASVARLIGDPMVPVAVSAAGRYSAQFLRGIDKALSVKPQDRPQNMAELRTWLGLDEGPATVRAPQAAPSPPAPPPLDSQADLVTVAAPVRVAPAPAAPAQVPPSEPAPAASPAPQRAAITPLKPWTKAMVALAIVLIVVVAPALYFLFGSTEQRAPQPPAPEQAKPAASEPSLTTPPTREPPVPAATEKPAPTVPVLPAQAEPSRPSGAKAAPPVVESSPARKNTKRPAGAGTKSECVDILQRASLGEPLTQAEQATLTEECR